MWTYLQLLIGFFDKKNSSTSKGIEIDSDNKELAARKSKKQNQLLENSKNR